MLKRIELTAPSATVARLVNQLRDAHGVVGIQIVPNGSVEPVGDVLRIDALTSVHLEIMSLLTRELSSNENNHSMSVMELRASISPIAREALHKEEGFCSWEEIQATISKQSNMRPTMIAILIVSGLVGAIGISNGAIHLVIAAMVVAPGFEPIVRVPLGLITRGSDWKNGLMDMLKGYVALATGAVLGGLLMLVANGSVFTESDVSTTPRSLIDYWTASNAASITVALLSGFAGAILLGTGRAVLTSGVMIALALIPSICIAGLSAAATDWGLMSTALLRWTVEVLCVSLGASVFWVVYRLRVDRRRSLY